MTIVLIPVGYVSRTVLTEYEVNKDRKNQAEGRGGGGAAFSCHEVLVPIDLVQYKVIINFTTTNQSMYSIPESKREPIS